MQRTKIKTIEKYLTRLPDSAVEQVIAFVSYLNFMKNVESEYPYPDERAAIEQYRSEKTNKVLDWDTVKARL
ncbi:MAG: hypothetical protein LBJ25_00470 [Candidatus Margulisbacteria bacterium]|jgi:hypothetical protein|nr:hypothetical protein [Candidatus Margulisiibacteriota bacterium]